MEQKKKLNTFDIFSLGFGGAVGSGIFVMMGLGIGHTGKSIVIALLCGCVIMLLAYMYNVVFSSMFVLSGGDYSQKAMVFSPLLTGVSGIFTVLNGFALAMYSVSIVSYAGSVFPGILPYTKVIAILITTLFFASTIKGSKFIAIIQNIMTVVLLFSIALFILVGILKVKGGFFTDGDFFLNGPGGLISAVAIMGFACQGTTMAPVAMAKDTANPKKTLPIAIFMITITLAIVYGLMGVVASGVLPVEEVAGKTLSVVAFEIFPQPVYVIFILGGAVFAIATSLMGGIALLKYPVLKVAEDGWLPGIFKKTTKQGYPWASQLLFYIISVIPVLLGFSFDSIVSLIMIPTMLLCACCNFYCILLPKKYPKQWKESVLHMPTPVFTFVMLLSVGCDFLVAYNLFAMLTGKEVVMVFLIVLFCFVLAFIRLKTGAVKVEDLKNAKARIVEEALNDSTDDIISVKRANA